MRFLTGLIFVTSAITFGASSTVMADPTRPPSPAEIRAWFQSDSATPARRAWQLQSVLLSEHRSVAIINGQRLGVGDRIDQAEIVAIEPGRVVLDHAGERISLTINSDTKPVRQSFRN